MRVTATRSGDWWAIEAEHDGQPIYTQAKRLDQVDELVRDAFTTLDIDLAGESIDVVPVIGSAEVAEAARTASKQAAQAAKAASESMRRAVSKLQGDGLPVRDVAVLLDISPQRVSQLSAVRVAAPKRGPLKKAPAATPAASKVAKRAAGKSTTVKPATKRGAIVKKPKGDQRSRAMPAAKSKPDRPAEKDTPRERPRVTIAAIRSPNR